MGLRGAQKRALEGPVFRCVSGLERLKHGTLDAEMIRSGCICVPDTHTEALDDSGALLVFVGGDFGLEAGSKKGAGGPIFRSLSDLESLAYGIVDAEMIGSGCFCVPDIYTEALDDSGALLVFVGGDFGLERGSEKGAGGPHF